MSTTKSITPVITPNASSVCLKKEWEGDQCCKPDFIYGGPFINVKKDEPFLDTATPFNLQLQGTFKKSFAYYSLKERMPVILTKIIDYLSRDGGIIQTAHSTNTEDIRAYIKYVTKLKNDLVTNKKYDLLEGSDADKWNTWIGNLDNAHYFTNTWIFTECYVYRRLREGCELSKGLQNFDPFDDQKNKSFDASLEAMCVVADRVVTMLPQSDKDKRKADFITLLKICLWANKCDMSLSMGEQVTFAGSTTPAGQTTQTAPIDPFQMIIDFKDKLLVDDTAKVADQVVAKAQNLAKAIEGDTLAASARPPEGEEETEEPPKIPCPAKMVLAQAVMFDIVCDNAGYELFADLCLAHFLISQKIVQKIRFHVKKMPWFVSDVTETDFKFMIESCINASFSRTIVPEPKPEPKEGEAPAEEEPPRDINAENVKALGQQWSELVADGTFEVMAEDYWTWPHCYNEMKKYDYNLYRKLQYAVAILFKGDLNYRKLLGEKKCSPVLGFEPALQGFIPAPIIAVRTVKADLICGLPKGKWDALNKIDAKWMEKGDYGVIHFCAKAEPLKPSDRPCIDYGDLCRGTGCPVHTDM